MKRKPAGADQEKVRAWVDLSALYPSDPLKPRRRASKRRAAARCAGGHCEKQAVREALEGWRWI